MIPNPRISKTQVENLTTKEEEVLTEVSDMKSLTENCLQCTKNIGIELYYVKEIGEIGEYHQPGIYGPGHYEKQAKLVNGRIYFRKGCLGIWWNR